MGRHGVPSLAVSSAGAPACRSAGLSRLRYIHTVHAQIEDEDGDRTVMKILRVVFALLIFSSQLAMAADSDLDPLIKGSRGITGWLKGIGEDLHSLMAVQDKNQLRQRLHSLNEALYAVESAKIQFVADIKRSHGLPTEIPRLESSAQELVPKIAFLKTSIDGVAVMMTEEFRGKATRCENDLNDAATMRKQWVGEIASNPSLLADAAQRQQEISQGNEAITALQSARVEIADLMAELQ